MEGTCVATETNAQGEVETMPLYKCFCLMVKHPHEFAGLIHPLRRGFPFVRRPHCAALRGPWRVNRGCWMSWSAAKLRSRGRQPKKTTCPRLVLTGYWGTPKNLQIHWFFMMFGVRIATRGDPILSITIRMLMPKNQAGGQ